MLSKQKLRGTINDKAQIHSAVKCEAVTWLADSTRTYLNQKGPVA